nr:hypothetical protein [Kibdelosporangium sp. MJ126-NF4]CTQ95381.1 hypothetical protein [Kibdelosporangium sp. MJ126-NF4]
MRGHHSAPTGGSRTCRRGSRATAAACPLTARLRLGGSRVCAAQGVLAACAQAHGGASGVFPSVWPGRSQTTTGQEVGLRNWWAQREALPTS